MNYLFEIKRFGSSYLMRLLLYIFRIFPIKNNKIIASAVRGRRYADNPRYIVEELLRRERDLDVVWLKRSDSNYMVPESIRTVINRRNYIQLAYEFATAKIIIMSHHAPAYYIKRKGQVFIQTWHGGLGIKKIELDAINFIKSSKYEIAELKATNLADVFISNSLHLSKLYRSAFNYSGPIFNCGYPKNDYLLGDKTAARTKVRMDLNIMPEYKIVTYAPTFRDSFRQNGAWKADMSVYDIDYERILKAFETKKGGNFVVLIKMHPNIQNSVHFERITNKHIIDATKYNDMQELVMASDFFISDYSSCIFDAATAGIPCFTYAKDFDDYKSDRGVYYEMEELPFPYAKNNDEMEDNILNFDEKKYCEAWMNFAEKVELNETGHAAKDIADKICEVLDGKPVNWNNSLI